MAFHASKDAQVSPLKCPRKKYGSLVVAVLAAMAGAGVYLASRGTLCRWTLARALAAVVGAAVVCALWPATTVEQLLRAAATAPLFAWPIPLALEMRRCEATRR